MSYNAFLLGLSQWKSWSHPMSLPLVLLHMHAWLWGVHIRIIIRIKRQQSTDMETMSADTKNLNCSFFQGNDNHWNIITHWSVVSRHRLPHCITSQSIETKPAKKPLVRWIVEVGLNSLRQGQLTRHGVLLILFKSPLTVARGRGNNMIYDTGITRSTQSRYSIV